MDDMVLVATATLLTTWLSSVSPSTRDPWLSLPFEALEAVTIHLMAVSMSLFCASAAPTGLLATLHGLSGGIHYSVGTIRSFRLTHQFKCVSLYIVQAYIVFVKTKFNSI